MDYINVFTNSLGYKLKKAQQLVQEGYLKQTAVFGLTPIQVYVLCILKDKKLIRPSEFATILDISRPSTTALIKRMERDGLVQRMPDPANRRQVWVLATEKGSSLMEMAKTSLELSDQELGAMGISELQEFKSLLDTLNAVKKPANEN